MHRTQDLLPRLLVLAMFIALGAIATPGIVDAEGDVHWGYEGEEGPEHWGDLSEDFALCASGQEQSPIDIASGSTVNMDDIVFNYQPSDVNVVNNGHTIQANYDAGSSIQVDGETYKLLQFHFHSPSEHTMAGSPAPMEAHFVHQSAGGDLAVVGVMLESGAENAAYAPVLDNMPDMAGDPQTIEGATVNAADLLPASTDRYRYMGSLTTPPCSEDVKWFVMTEPVTLSSDQIAAYQALYTGNARPVQAMNARSFLDTGAMDTGAAATAVEAPAQLPKTGGDPVSLALAGLLGFASLSTGAGLYVRRRVGR